MSAARHYLPPVSIASSTLHSPPWGDSASSHTVNYSGNWAGHVMPYTNFQDQLMTFSEATWTQPSVPGNSSYTNYQDAPDASFWDGLGLDYLIQAGADSISTATPTYKFWVEDYPEGTDWEANPPISAGDLSFVDVHYVGNNQSNFFLENETTYTYTTVSLSTPYVGNHSGDFINECISSYYLPDYGTTSFTGCYATAGGTTYPLQSSNNNIYYMTSNGQSTGTLLVSTGSVNNSSYSFPVTWGNPGP
jgi:hypothetical protein